MQTKVVGAENRTLTPTSVRSSNQMANNSRLALLRSLSDAEPVQSLHI
jgi:hypothetical protein